MPNLAYFAPNISNDSTSALQFSLVTEEVIMTPEILK